jgi:hypothetical protein
MAPTRKFTTAIPATIVFHGEELKAFAAWRSNQQSTKNQTSDLKESYMLSDAIEHDNFKRWYSKCLDPVALETPQIEKNVATLRSTQIARTCKHPLHPALIEVCQQDPTNSLHLRCPVCFVQTHQDFLDAIMTTWKQHGGPWSKERSVTSPYEQCMVAHHRAKVVLVNAIPWLEDLAEREAIWEAEHSDAELDEVEEYSASQALAEYRMGIVVPNSQAP